jgi:hypothetical protein
MADYDVFNGDADGICALVQLRQAEPRDTTLVTGVKRNIQLLKQVTPNGGDRVTVLDISMAKNNLDLVRILDSGATVFYVDHHSSGPVPASSSLISLINESANVSTSVLVNQYLRGSKLLWATVGTFGDNLKQVANGMLKNTDISREQRDLLEKLGIYMNYNGYGADIEDLHFAPADLYCAVIPYSSPLEFIDVERHQFDKLESGYHQDLNAANQVKPYIQKSATSAYILPDQPWARRVSGAFSNNLTNKHPQKAHAVLTQKSCGNYLVSVRAPLSNKTGASRLCSSFATGGGREAAAGINNLPSGQLDEFMAKFQHAYK